MRDINLKVLIYCSAKGDFLEKAPRFVVFRMVKWSKRIMSLERTVLVLVKSHLFRSQVSSNNIETIFLVMGISNHFEGLSYSLVSFSLLTVSIQNLCTRSYTKSLTLKVSFLARASIPHSITSWRTYCCGHVLVYDIVIKLPKTTIADGFHVGTEVTLRCCLTFYIWSYWCRWFQLNWSKNAT